MSRHQDPNYSVAGDPTLAAPDVEESMEALGSSTTHPHLRQLSESTNVSNFVLLGKLKSVLHEVITSLCTPGNTYSIDDYIALTEESMRALKAIKVERRIESRRANSALRNSPAAPLTSPAVREFIEEGEEQTGNSPSRQSGNSPTQPPRTYMAALLKHKKVSPKRSQCKADAQTRTDLEASRYTSALRSEDRQRQAEERRLDHLQEIKMKSEAADARGQRAKERREEAERRQRRVAQDRLEGGLRRAEEARKQTVERVHRAHSRVEEVRFNNELRQQTKVLLLDKKMSEVEHNQEQMREERQRVAQERHDAMLAAAERRRNLSQERVEKQQQRELQRQENLRRVEEQRRIELELKQQKAEEWEKKVRQHQQTAHAEAEALSRKTEEKFQQSAQLLEEQRERFRQKLERQDQKLREVRQRRDRESEARPLFAELMPVLSIQEEEQVSQRVSKLAAASQRQGKAFTDNYQKESLSSTKDLNRSRLRPPFSRLSTFIAAPSVPQCKQPLVDIASGELADVDHEFLRYFNYFDVLVKVFLEARKVKDTAILRQSGALLRSLLCNEKEGKQNAIYFVRSGNAVQLAVCVREEVKQLRQHHNSETLCQLLYILGVCLDRVSTEALCSVRLQTVRDQLLNEMEVIGLDRVCVAALKLASTDGELELAYNALSILNTYLTVFVRRKGDNRPSWFQNTTAAVFALLQSLLTPGGNPLHDDSGTLSCAHVVLLFCTFRVLNGLARWQLVTFQSLLHDLVSTTAMAVTPTPAAGCAVSVNSPKEEVTTQTTVQITRMELFHALNSFFTYIHAHSEDLETLPSAPPSAEGGEGGVSASFEEAGKFGLTLPGLSAFPPPDEAPEAREYLPGGKRYCLRAALHECILLMGYLSLDDALLQDMFTWGTGKTLLDNVLCTLPIPYFTNARHILFPTVLALLLNNHRNAGITKVVMDVHQLYTFIQEEYDGLSKKAKAYAQDHYQQLLTCKHSSDPRSALLETMISVRGKSWAELSDDDDQQLSATARSAEAGGTTPVLEKDKLCKSFRAPGVSTFSLFRLDRRIPISYWPAVLKQLEELQA